MSINNLKPFNFDTPELPVNWLVEGLIPFNSMSIVASQSGVGKSWLIEYLGMCVVSNNDFLGKKTVHGDVLLIDQDTTTSVLNKRIRRLNRGIKRKYNYYVESMKGYTISDMGIINLINSSPSVKLVILDALHGMLGELDVNNVHDMTILSNFKERILQLDRDIAIIIVHHTTEKIEYDVDEMMSENDIGKYFMGSSVLNQVADQTFLIHSPDRNRPKLKMLYLRPLAKRFQIDEDRLKLKFIDDIDESKFIVDGRYESNDIIEIRIQEILNKSDKLMWKPIDICNSLSGLHGVMSVRTTLNRMIKQKKVNFSVTKHNLHMISAKNRKRVVKKKVVINK